MYRKKILLVDDSATILIMEKFIFRNDPYEIVTAADGVEAIEKAVEHRPDLILLDLTMPRLDGMETCRQLRAKEQTRATPVIIVANRYEADAVRQDLNCGCNGFVMKPINALELLTKVRSLLGDGAAA
jgi:CheY-like chemotaxis protein